MKDLWKYVSLTLGLSLIGIVIMSLITTTKLKDRIIECQSQIPDTTYVEVHDTVTFEKPVVKWKTRTEYDTVTNSDTVWYDSIVVINNYIEHPIDSFSVTSSYTDSNINATINIEGRGVVDKTFIDSVSMDYKYVQQQLVPKKCCWLRRLFNKCK